jgi:hypothetical protein
MSRTHKPRPAAMAPSGGKLLALGHMLMCVFFLLAAYVQLNDPDPLEWAAAYAVPAAACAYMSVHAAAGAVPALPAAVALVVAAVPVGVGATIAAPAAAALRAGGGLLHVLEKEEVRELCGITLVIAWLAFGFATQREKGGVVQGGKAVAGGIAASSGAGNAGVTAMASALLAVAAWAAWAALVGSGAVHVDEHCTGLGAFPPDAS